MSSAGGVETSWVAECSKHVVVLNEHLRKCAENVESMSDNIKKTVVMLDAWGTLCGDASSHASRLLEEKRRIHVEPASKHQRPRKRKKDGE